MFKTLFFLKNFSNAILRESTIEDKITSSYDFFKNNNIQFHECLSEIKTDEDRLNFYQNTLFCIVKDNYYNFKSFCDENKLNAINILKDMFIKPQKMTKLEESIGDYPLYEFGFGSYFLDKIKTITTSEFQLILSEMHPNIQNYFPSDNNIKINGKVQGGYISILFLMLLAYEKNEEASILLSLYETKIVEELNEIISYISQKEKYELNVKLIQLAIYETQFYGLSGQNVNTILNKVYNADSMVVNYIEYYNCYRNVKKLEKDLNKTSISKINNILKI